MTDDNPTATESNREEGIQTEYVERSDVGVSLTVKLKRGTATRDQDELTAKVKAQTLAEAREDMDTLRAYLHDVAEDVRQIQPNEGEE
ncbi:hypothetical protein C457_11451 [Haloferax prahovense DSM 18310]|uniref:DUF7389 domain-containing protein n=1 Tax=Haloferax prahovense (strain DSM 18310 / JCM 13924 / TL6) TaxID=1227461 RepID=M0GAR4_HALPT|nr:hypothetical protein [Haloferax prahovense]ELZ68617.1 hypothetical protein C457_11451 [Haloferax prahovense DSM 18310]